MGFTLFYLILIVIIPLSALFYTTASMSFSAFIQAISSDRVLHAYLVSFGIAFIAALINSFFGLIVTWVLVRYRFWGRRMMNTLVDLPFALPTAIAGIALTTLYAPHGWIGQYFMRLNIKISFTPLGILVALIFVGFPFVVRSIQPVLEKIERLSEEAAMVLGASRWKTFTRVIFPQLLPSLLTGFALAFARGLGEYGSVIFIAGNVPGLSEIVPIIIVMKLEQYDYAGATAIALVMLLASFCLLLILNSLQKWKSRWSV